MKKILILSLLLLTGCQSLRDEKVLVAPEMVERQKMVLTPLSPVQQTNVEWHVINRQNFESKIKSIEEKQGPTTFFALTPQGYQNLSMNVAELRRYIVQLNAQIASIKEYYEAPIKKETQNGK